MKKIINYTNYEQDIEKINRIQKIKQANKKRNDLIEDIDRNNEKKEKINDLLDNENYNSN